MAGAKTLAQLKTRVRQRTDNEHTGGAFVTDAEITGLLNTAYAKLYSELVRFGIHVAEEIQTITADGSSDYDLDEDLFAVVGVFRVDTNGQRTRLSRHGSRHRPNLSANGIGVTYRVTSDAIQFSPIPSSGTYEVVYVPVPGELSADEDIVDGVLGWEEFLILDASIAILTKEESDVRVLVAERDRMLARIQDDAAAAEMTESWVIGDGSGGVGELLEGEYTDRRGYRGSFGSWRW